LIHINGLWTNRSYAKLNEKLQGAEPDFGDARVLTVFLSQGPEQSNSETQTAT
jgi:hypothetical protein